MKRTGRWLRRLAFALPLLAVACASSADPSSGPSVERQTDILGLVAGTALLIGLGTLMYIDNQD
jgi:hypothetical protein